MKLLEPITIKTSYVFLTITVLKTSGVYRVFPPKDRIATNAAINQETSSKYGMQNIKGAVVCLMRFCNSPL